MVRYGAAAAILYCLLSGLAEARPLAELDLVAEPVMVAGSVQCALFTAWTSSDAWSREAAPGEIEVALESGGSASSLAALAFESGVWVPLCFAVPVGASGRVALRFRLTTAAGEAEEVLSVQVLHKERVHLAVDRPQARPGEKVRWRLLRTRTVNGEPVEGGGVQLELKDPRGNSVWSGEVATGQGGMASGEWPLDTEPAMGRWEADAKLGPARASAPFEVRQVRLPAFFVSLQLRPEGQDWVAEGRSWRPDGTPVKGRAKLWVPGGPDLPWSKLGGQGEVYFRWRGAAGEKGRSGVAILRVEDDAGRREEKSELTTDPAASSLIAVAWPLDTPLACGQVGRMVVGLLGRDGAPEPTRVSVDWGHGTQQVEAPDGVAEVEIKVPCADSLPGALNVKVKAAPIASGIEIAAAQVELPLRKLGDERFVTAPALVEPGPDGRLVIGVRAHWGAAPAPLRATAFREGAAVGSAALESEGDGWHSGTLSLGEGVHGLLTVRVHSARLAADGRNIASEWEERSTVVFARPPRLHIDLSEVGDLRPGQRVRARAQIRNELGEPADAVLAASVVDLRAVALGVSPLGAIEAWSADRLRESTRASSGAFAAAAGWASRWAAGIATEAEKTALSGAVRTIAPDESRSEVRLRAAALMKQTCAMAFDAFEAAVNIQGKLDGAVVSTDSPSGPMAPLAQMLEAGGPSANFETAWAEPMAWSDLNRCAPESLGAEALGRRVSALRVERLAIALLTQRKGLARLAKKGWSGDVGELASAVGLAPIPQRDAWGRSLSVSLAAKELTVRSAGQDGVLRTRDDIVDVRAWREPRGAGGLGLRGTGTGFGGSRSVVAYGMGGVAKIGAPADAIVRSNFDETALWQTGLAANGGEAELDVPLADQVTTWQVDVLGISPQGALGQVRAHWLATLPVWVEDLAPAELAVGDSYAVPVVVNRRPSPGGGEIQQVPGTWRVSYSVGGALSLDGPRESVVDVPAGGVAPAVVMVRATEAGEGTIEVVLTAANTGEVADRLKRTLLVQPQGELSRHLTTAKIESNVVGGAEIALYAPSGAGAGAVRRQLRALRGAADFALEGIEALVREPHGCFEQTSSAVYPNLLVARLLGVKSADAGAREVVEDAVAKCGRGYQRLVSYEVQGGGFSWFGDAPANRVLTAYGLLEFAELAAVWPVDDKLIARTRTWLVNQQGADGRWEPDPSWLHDWSAVQGNVATTAYIAWALAHAGGAPKAVDKALVYLRRHASELRAKPHLLALWASAEARAGGRSAEPWGALQALLKDPGALKSMSPTQFYASGAAAKAEVLALAAEAAHFGGPATAAAVSDLLPRLVELRDQRWGWGNTQSTVLALRAFATQAGESPPQDAVLRIFDGQRQVAEVALGASGAATIELPPGLGAHLRAQVDPPADVFAELRTSWRQPLARAPIAEGLEVDLQGPSTPILAGEPYSLRFRASNPSAAPVALPTISVPIPPGSRASLQTLSALKQHPSITRVEDVGSALYLYAEVLPAGASIDVDISLEAEAACDVLLRPAAAWAYYTPELRGLSAPGRIVVERE